MLRNRYNLVLENLVLRQQIALLQRRVGHPHLRSGERLFWMILSRLWSRWRENLLVVKPETVIRWHREGFRRFWTRKCRRGPGRPSVSIEIRDLIRKMSKSNPFWGAPRIHGELQQLGIDVSQASVSRYMLRNRKPPSQRWKAFLDNHVQDMVSIDFFTVPTVTCQVLFAIVVLSHDRRRVIHSNVTYSPSAEWTAQQMAEAFPYDSAPRFLLRDRDSIYGDLFHRRVDRMGIEQIRIAPRSPWQNPFVERVIGSIRRECLDHVVVLGEKHLRRILKSYFEYYNDARTHLSLDKNAPNERTVETPEMGEIVAKPMVGGLHHRYSRKAA